MTAAFRYRPGLQGDPLHARQVRAWAGRLPPSPASWTIGSQGTGCCTGLVPDQPDLILRHRRGLGPARASRASPRQRPNAGAGPRRRRPAPSGCRNFGCRRAWASWPAARPPPRTGPSAAPGRSGGAGHAAPSPTGPAPSCPPARRSACPTPGHIPGAGTSQRRPAIHPGPRWQVTQPALHRPGRSKTVTGQLERQVLGVLAQMTGAQIPRRQPLRRK